MAAAVVARSQDATRAHWARQAAAYYLAAAIVAISQGATRAHGARHSDRGLLSVTPGWQLVTSVFASCEWNCDTSVNQYLLYKPAVGSQVMFQVLVTTANFPLWVFLGCTISTAE